MTLHTPSGGVADHYVEKSFAREARIKKHPLGKELLSLESMAKEALKAPDGPLGKKSVEHKLHAVADILLKKIDACAQGMEHLVDDSGKTNPAEVDTQLAKLATRCEKYVERCDGIAHTAGYQTTIFSSEMLEYHMQQFMKAHALYADAGKSKAEVSSDPVLARINNDTQGSGRVAG